MTGGQKGRKLSREADFNGSSGREWRADQGPLNGWGTIKVATLLNSWI